MSHHNKPEPFGYFKAEPFGWTDCAETNEGAQPLYDQAAIDELIAERDNFYMDYRIKCDEETKRLHEQLAEVTKQRDELLGALSELTSTVGLAIDGSVGWDAHKNARNLIASIKESK